MAASATADPTVQSAPAQPAFAAGKLLSGATALIFATGMERGFGFLANLLAARIGGASTFGAYSLAMTTANNIAAYAGAGIGATATRFSGQYPEGTAGYRALTRALALVSVGSALFATALLFGGAGPLARVLLNQPAVENLLRWASLSAGVMILFECCRGFLVGQHRLGSLVLFSGVMGGGMIAALPFASRLGAVPMLLTQAAIAAAATGAVLLTGRSRSATAFPVADAGESVGAIARRVWNFGLVQLLGIVGLNAAGWWIASLVARSDATLVEMGMFAVANQVRNIVALVPGLLTQSSYALMANEDAAPGRVLVFCTFAATLVVVLLGGLGIVALPWLLPLLWGKTYLAGVLAASLALATAIVHMAASPAAARLTIVSLPYTGFINAIWSVLVVGLSLALLMGARAGAASAIAMGIYLVAHLVAAALVLLSLQRYGVAPNGLAPLFFIGNGAAFALAGLSACRVAFAAGGRAVLFSGCELAVVLAAAGLTVAVGQRQGFALSSLAGPAATMLRKLRPGAAR